jgi:hypothetical protein
MPFLYFDSLRQGHQINPLVGLREFARYVIMGRFFTSQKKSEIAAATDAEIKPVTKRGIQL